jgi:hypothetical protein
MAQIVAAAGLGPQFVDGVMVVQICRFVRNSAARMIWRKPRLAADAAW